MKTCLDIQQSLRELFKDFTKKFIEQEFFTFVQNNLLRDYQYEKIKILVVKLIERTLLAQRCHDDQSTAENLGVLNCYIRFKKLSEKGSKHRYSICYLFLQQMI